MEGQLGWLGMCVVWQRKVSQKHNYKEETQIGRPRITWTQGERYEVEINL